MNKIDLNGTISAMETDTIFSHITALDGGDYEYLFTYMKQIAGILRAGHQLREAYGRDDLDVARELYDKALLDNGAYAFVLSVFWGFIIPIVLVFMGVDYVLGKVVKLVEK